MSSGGDSGSLNDGGRGVGAGADGGIGSRIRSRLTGTF